MKLMIGVPTQEYARRADFYDYYYALQRPDCEVLQIFARGQSPAKNRNNIIKAALEHNCTHILFIDDDMAFQPDSLLRLVMHDVDVVSGLYYFRGYPNYPVIFDARQNDGKCQRVALTEDVKGLMEVINCGFGFVLVKTEIFKSIPEPWLTLGEIEKDEWCDDIPFFNKVKDAGFKIYCDFDVWVGHMASMTVWPNKIDGKWMVSYADITGQALNFPAVVREKVLEPQI